MQSLAERSQSAKIANKSEHPPKAGVLLSCIKTLESEAERRGLIARERGDNFTPLWFIAETERNIFLWRRGCSLIQEDEFEFWVDIEGLIAKRLKQLESTDSENPFTNPLWGYASFDEGIRAREKRYLSSLRGVVSALETHIHALSIIGSELSKESRGSREFVVLPSASRI